MVNQSTAPEELDQNEANRAVTSRLDQCVRSTSSIGGRYVAEIHIIKDGSITKSEVRTPAGVGDQRLSNCLAKRLGNVKFPKSNDPEQVLRFEVDYHMRGE